MRTRRFALPLLALTAMSIAALGGARPAVAHAKLEQSAPAADSVLAEPPEAVELLFSEPVDPSLGGIDVIAPDGSRADWGDVEQRDGDTVVRMPVAADQRGTYTVSWSVVSRDGHTISGSYVFSVGEVTGSGVAVDSDRSFLRFAAGAARWAAYAGTILLVGALAFAVLVVPGSSRRLHSLCLGAAILALLGSVGVRLTQVALASGRPLLDVLAVLGDAIADLRFARLALVRVAFAAVAVLFLVGARDADRAWRRIGLAVSATGLVVVPSLSGHAWTADEQAVAVVVDALHFLAAGVWIGGLAALLAVAPGRDDTAPVTARFSAVALVTVAVVVATGAASAFLQLDEFGALIDAAWGRWLLAKVALVAVIVALGWLNRSRYTALLPDRTTVFTVVRAELAVAAAVVALTAVLVNLPPERAEAPAAPFAATVALTGDGATGDVQVEVVPARAGENDVHLFFVDGGEPMAVDAVELTVGREGVSPRRVEVSPILPNHSSAYLVSMPTPGTWTLTVTAVREGVPATAVLEVPIR